MVPGSVPVTADGKDQPIKWKSGCRPWDSRQDYRGGLLVKFYLTNAKLYSYTFTLPDPDGQLERGRLNARWCEMIKHRSDQWDRASNEPAAGVSPFWKSHPKSFRNVAKRPSPYQPSWRAGFLTQEELEPGKNEGE